MESVNNQNKDYANHHSDEIVVNMLQFSETNQEGKVEKGSKVDRESKHEDVKHLCNLCKYEANSKRYLKRNCQSQHEGVRYSCDQCEHQSTDRGHLKRHIQRKHNDVEYSS